MLEYSLSDDSESDKLWFTESQSLFLVFHLYLRTSSTTMLLKQRNAIKIISGRNCHSYSGIKLPDGNYRSMVGEMPWYIKISSPKGRRLFIGVDKEEKDGHGTIKMGDPYWRPHLQWNQSLKKQKYFHWRLVTNRMHVATQESRLASSKTRAAFFPPS